eukprot:EG_transcript_15130
MKVLKFRVGKGPAEDVALKAAIEATGVAVSKAKDPAATQVTIKHAAARAPEEEVAAAPAPAGGHKRRFHDTLEEWQPPGAPHHPPDPEAAAPRQPKRRFQEDLPNETPAAQPDAGAPYVGEMD